MDGLCLQTAIHGVTPAIGVPTGSLATASVSSGVRSSEAAKTTAFSRFSFRSPLRSLWSGRRRVALDDAVLVDHRGAEEMTVVDDDDDREAENWILKILQVRSLWREDEQQRNSLEKARNIEDLDDHDRSEGSNGGDGCRVDDDDDDEKHGFDRDSFSRLLRRVSLSEAKLYAQMSYLGNIAYCIPKIQPGNLLRCYGLRFVTSSIDKRESIPQDQSPETQEPEKAMKSSNEEEDHKSDGYGIRASAAYRIVASAASSLHSRTRLPFGPSKNFEDLPEDCCNDGVKRTSSEMASLMATTDSVTAVVAAKEEVKQAVADDLNSTLSSPCEWYVCDDDETATRFIAIQGSESLASWQANLLFEPVEFEGLDVIVHRGIYEAAKGMYEQMLPEIRAHLRSRGDRATFRLTGHSLGGSLALLINLMLLIRNEVPISSLLPVITFGSPSIMCGGDGLLRKLGLPCSHVKAVTMHRDIVPRAFSCHYPNHVAELLKAINGNFRNHPCLSSQNVLYAPMGDLLILQPDEKFSPSHELLPPGIGLYLLSSAEKKLLREAKGTFLNTPHPLEILGDRSAYGSDGAVQRDHDMDSYLKCVRGFIRQELNRVRKLKRERRRSAWWPLVAPRGVDAGIVVRTGRSSVERLGRFVASQRVHLFVVLLLPARLLLLGAFSMLNFH